MSDYRIGTWKINRRRGQDDRTYYVLVSRKNKDGTGTNRSLTIGYVDSDTPEDDERTAQAIRVRMNRLTQHHPGAALELVATARAADPKLTCRQLMERIDEVDGPRPGRLTLREYHDRVYWPERSEQPRGSLLDPVTAKTIAGEESHWKRILAGPLADICVGDLGQVEINRWLRSVEVSDRKGGTRPASAATRRLLKAAIRTLLKFATLSEHIDSMPDLSLITIRADKVSRQKTEGLFPSEALALLNACTVLEWPRERAMFALGMFAGLRPSELVRVRWEDVDLQTRTLYVRGTKTDESAATVPLLGGQVIEELTSWHQHCGEPTEGLCFPHPHTGEQVTEYKKSLRTASELAEIGKHVTPYSLRHTFPGLAKTAGIDMDTARIVMRHTGKSEVLESVYLHPDPALLADIHKAATLIGEPTEE